MGLYYWWLLFAGHPVCREAFAHLLGVGKRRLTRCRSSYQGRDLRTVGGRGGTFDQTAGLRKFQGLSFISQGLSFISSLWLRKFTSCIIGRCSGSSAPPSVQSASVTGFLIHLYWSAAEPMSTANLGTVCLYISLDIWLNMGGPGPWDQVGISLH